MANKSFQSFKMRKQAKINQTQQVEGGNNTESLLTIADASKTKQQQGSTDSSSQAHHTQFLSQKNHRKTVIGQRKVYNPIQDIENTHFKRFADQKNLVKEQKISDQFKLVDKLPEDWSLKT